MTADERALLLVVAKWALGLESGAALDMKVDAEAHPGLLRLRELIAKVEAAGEEEEKEEEEEAGG